MKTAKGNDKLGKSVTVMSRPVGNSCPTECFFLGNGCYAEKTERRFGNARVAGFTNMELEWGSIGTAIKIAYDSGRSIRIHERGDFLTEKDDRKVIDWNYLNAWKKALKWFKDEYGVLPDIWVYSHAYFKAVSDLANFGVKVYASVHNNDHIRKAKKAGFKLFAFCTTIKKKKGGSKDHKKRIDLPVLGNTLVCPEQIMGRKRVTCDTCKWCITGKGNVAFLEH